MDGSKIKALARFVDEPKSRKLTGTGDAARISMINCSAE